MKSVRSWLTLALVALPLATVSAQPLQEFYIPLPEEESLLAAQVLDATLADTNIRTVISITAAGNNTIVYYDHWEDGYDLDPQRFDASMRHEAEELIPLHLPERNPERRAVLRASRSDHKALVQGEEPKTQDS